MTRLIIAWNHRKGEPAVESIEGKGEEYILEDKGCPGDVRGAMGDGHRKG